MANTNMQKLLNATKGGDSNKVGSKVPVTRNNKPPAAFGLSKSGKMPKSSHLMMVELDHDQVVIFKYHDRHISSIKSSKVQQMRESIKEEGQIFPGIVRTTDQITDSGKKVYELIVGRLRFEATRGFTKFKAVINELSDAEAVRIMIAENEDRKDITPFERWLSILPLVEDNVLSISEIAKLNNIDRGNLSKNLKAKEMFTQFNLVECLDDVESVKLNQVMALYDLYVEKKDEVTEAIRVLRDKYPEIKNNSFLKAVNKRVNAIKEKHTGKVFITGSKVLIRRIGTKVDVSFDGIPTESDIQQVLDEMRKLQALKS